MKNTCYVGARLHDLRMERNPVPTKAEVGRAAEISAAMYGMIENNKRPASDRVLILLADFYNVSVEDLMQETESFSPIREALAQVGGQHKTIAAEIFDDYTNRLERQEDFRGIGVDYSFVQWLASIGLSSTPERKKLDEPEPSKLPHFTYSRDWEVAGLKFRYCKGAEVASIKDWHGDRNISMSAQEVKEMQENFINYAHFYMFNYLKRSKEDVDIIVEKEGAKYSIEAMNFKQGGATHETD